MIELLFFAVLTGYLCFRLWGVFGTRTGFDKPPPENSISPQTDNVIALSQRKSKRDIIDAVILEPFEFELAKIKKEEPGFDVSDFLEDANLAYRTITEAFVEGDKKTLRMLLSPHTFEQFTNVIDNREEKGHRVVDEILGKVRSELTDVKVRENEAFLTVKFKSEQRYITYDENAQILDNYEEISAFMTHYWTFTKILGTSDPTWYLYQTRAGE